MGLSLFTCLMIQGGGAEAIASQSGEKWAGAIVHGPEHHHAGMLLCNTPAVYDTEEEALKAMNDIIQEITNMDFSNEN